MVAGLFRIPKTRPQHSKHKYTGKYAFQAQRRINDKGDLISVITSDIELLEVFYAHTISPAAIAFLYTVVMCLFIGAFHPALGAAACFPDLPMPRWGQKKKTGQ